MPPYQPVCRLPSSIFEWVLNFSAQDRIQKRYRHDGARYQVSPWALTWDDENYYMIAYEATSNSIRHYRVDKMEHIALTEQPRQGQSLFHDRFNPADYSRKVFGMFSGEEKIVRLRCENRFIGVLRDRFGAGLMVQPLEDGYFAVNVTVAVSPHFFSWVFGLGGGVQIMEPQVCASAASATVKATPRLSPFCCTFPLIYYVHQRKGEPQMNCSMEYVNGHIEVYDENGEFLFSADNKQEALSELASAA